jgi:hypothetical protein
MLHIISSLVFVIIVVGILLRRSPRVHLSFMLAAFTLDLGLTIYIEATRHAVEKVVLQTNTLIWFHAIVSSLVLLAYIVQIILGGKILTQLAGITINRQTHMVLGIIFCCLRLVNYVTSFMI